MTLKIIRILFALSLELIILAPAWPPAKEATAAGRINSQLILAMDAYPKNPVKEEKQTIKVDEAAAILVGVFIRYINTGTINTPPPMPNNPLITPIPAPIPRPPIIFFDEVTPRLSVSTAGDINMRTPARASTIVMIMRNGFTSICTFRYDPIGAPRLDEMIRGMASEKSTIFFRE